MPNTMTILGLVGNAIGAVFLATGQMTIGGLIILAMGPVDALDGTMARLRGMPTDFGAFVDSVTDRYSELVIFGGLIYYYLQQGDVLYASLASWQPPVLVLVSYARARPVLGHGYQGGHADPHRALYRAGTVAGVQHPLVGACGSSLF